MKWGVRSKTAKKKKKQQKKKKKKKKKRLKMAICKSLVLSYMHTTL